jgi:hypothetical protein
MLEPRHLTWRRRVLHRCLASAVLALSACGDAPPAEGTGSTTGDPTASTLDSPGGDGSQMMWLEVHEMLTRSLELSLSYKELDRAKALAVQALATAGANSSLGAAAQLACALAEEARRDKKAALLHLRAAVQLLPANATSTDAVVGAVLAAADLGGETAHNAREALDAWQARLEAASQPEALQAVAIATTTLDALPAKSPEPKHKLEIVVDPPAPAPTDDAEGAELAADYGDNLEYPVFIE